MPLSIDEELLTNFATPISRPGQKSVEKPNNCSSTQKVREKRDPKDKASNGPKPKNVATNSIAKNLPNNSEDIREVNRYVDWQRNILTAIEDFVSNPDETLLTFPCTLNSFQRLIIHETAEKFPVCHESVGDGAQRRIVLTKKVPEKDSVEVSVDASTLEEPRDEDKPQQQQEAANSENRLEGKAGQDSTKLADTTYIEQKRGGRVAKAKSKSKVKSERPLPSDEANLDDLLAQV